MKTYDVFLDYYDDIVRGINSPLDEEVQFLDEIIKKHSPKAHTILETACGTGSVAKEFLKYHYDIT
jgi:ubiquinone/menaquinone biosynthesis C-methylase UbiE